MVQEIIDSEILRLMWFSIEDIPFVKEEFVWVKLYSENRKYVILF